MVRRRKMAIIFAFTVVSSFVTCHGLLFKSLKVKKLNPVQPLLDELIEFSHDEIASFDVFKKMFNKTYLSVFKEHKALLNYLINQRDIKAHNLEFSKGAISFNRGLCELSDLSADEVNSFLNRFKRPVEAKAVKEYDEFEDEDEELPTTVNWVKRGYVTPVLNQALCGSCWSFSAIGAIEGQMFKKTGKLMRFSQQHLIDCNRGGDFGNFGCDGGDMITAFNFLMSQDGVALESKYPYRASDDFSCNYRKSKSGGKVISYETIEPGDEELLKMMVAKYGPISIAVDASLASFHSYKKGVYYDPKCSKIVNHAVLLVGYGTDKKTKKDYWLVKNSYGNVWGEKGYMRIARNADNHCGIAEFAVVPNCDTK